MKQNVLKKKMTGQIKKERIVVVKPSFYQTCVNQVCVRSSLVVGGPRP